MQRTSRIIYPLGPGIASGLGFGFDKLTGISPGADDTGLRVKIGCHTLRAMGIINYQLIIRYNSSWKKNPA